MGIHMPGDLSGSLSLSGTSFCVSFLRKRLRFVKTSYTVWRGRLWLSRVKIDEISPGFSTILLTAYSGNLVDNYNQKWYYRYIATTYRIKDTSCVQNI